MPQTAPNISRNDRRRVRTRSSLIGAARTVFAARGVESATIQEIADTADVAKGSFYNHFDSREDLLSAVAAATLEELGEILDRKVQGHEPDPARVVARSLLCTLRTCSEDPALGGFILQSAQLVEITEAALGARARRDLGDARERGRFRYDDLETVIAAVSGASLELLRRRLRGELDEAAETRLVALMLRMLGVEPDEADEIAAEAHAALEGGAGT